MQAEEQATADISALLDARAKFVEFVRRRVPSPELAEDIVQDGLLKALRGAGELRESERLVPWFYRLLQNAIADSYRRSNTANKYVAPVDVDVAGAEVAMSEEDDAELCGCFRGLLPALKDEYSEIIVTVELGGEEPSAAAERLGITVNNLKVRRHRARQALRERLVEACGTCSDHGCLDCSCSPS